jgi:hypothetical protein
LPDGLIFRIRVKPSRKKYFSFSETQIMLIVRHPAPHQEGRFAIVTSVGCGERWTRWRAQTIGAEADGKAVWS